MFTSPETPVQEQRRLTAGSNRLTNQLVNRRAGQAVQTRLANTPGGNNTLYQADALANAGRSAVPQRPSVNGLVQAGLHKKHQYDRRSPGVQMNSLPQTAFGEANPGIASMNLATAKARGTVGPLSSPYGTRTQDDQGRVHVQGTPMFGRQLPSHQQDALVNEGFIAAPQRTAAQLISMGSATRRRELLESRGAAPAGGNDYTAYRGRRAQRKSDARQMQTSRAQLRAGTMFNADNTIDMHNSLAARTMPVAAGEATSGASGMRRQQNVDPRLSLAAMTAGRTNDRQDAVASAAGLAQTASIANTQQMTAANVANMEAQQLINADRLAFDRINANSANALAGRTVGVQETLATQAGAQAEFDNGLATRRADFELGESAGSMTPEERMASGIEFEGLTPEQQAAGVNAAGQGMIEDPDNADQYSALLGASDEFIVNAYADAHQNPNSLFGMSPVQMANQTARIKRLEAIAAQRGLNLGSQRKRFPSLIELSKYASPANLAQAGAADGWFGN